MEKLQDKNILKKYDKLLAISFIMLSIAVMIIKVFNLAVSLALYNFIVTMIVPILFIIILKKRISKKYILPICVIFLCGICNCLMSFPELNNEDKIKNFVYFVVLVINLLMIYGIIVSNKEFKTNYSFKYMNIAIVSIAIIFCIYNLISNASQFEYFSNIKYKYTIKFSAFFPNRNNFALFLVLAIISTFLIKQSSKKTKTLITIQIFFILNLILTLSRSGIIALLIFIMSYLLLTKKKNKYIIAIIAIIIVIVMINPFNFLNIFEKFFIREDEGTSGRTEIWKDCSQLILKKPILGYGEILSKNVLEKESISSNTHNFYIKTILSYGIIGFISFIYLIYDLLKKEIYTLKKDNKTGAICIATTISLLVYGITEEINFFSFGLLNLLITYIGFIIPIYYYNRTRSKE